MFNAFDPQLLLTEVPDEAALGYLVCGCPMRCRGCHSSDSWDPHAGTPLTLARLAADLARYQGLITCVAFMGGEWQRQHLLDCLRLVRRHGLKTCLYTGLERLDNALMAQLDYLKTGRYIAERGGLDQPGTNQRFIAVATGQCLNHRFRERTYEQPECRTNS